MQRQGAALEIIFEPQSETNMISIKIEAKAYEFITAN
jgi:hypothetical protein